MHYIGSVNSTLSFQLLVEYVKHHSKDAQTGVQVSESQNKKVDFIFSDESVSTLGISAVPVTGMHAPLVFVFGDLYMSFCCLVILQIRMALSPLPLRQLIYLLSGCQRADLSKTVVRSVRCVLYWLRSQ